jgi:acetyl-CoA carboxylase carboxyl transferase subunit beta
MDFVLSARAAIAAITDSFSEFDADVVSTDPLAWPGYRDDLIRRREASGELESVVCGFGYVEGVKVVLVAFEFGFLGGSIGEAAASKIVDAFARAQWQRCPLVSLVASGGCRMQEGMPALAHMPTLAAGQAALRDVGCAHVSVLIGPVHGGVWASLSAGADVIVGVDDPTVAFAGHRARGDADDDAEPVTASVQHRQGQIDRVVSANVWADEVRALVGMLAGRRADPTAPDVPAALGILDLPADGWTAVQRARDEHRPRADAYLASYFESTIELSGDRVGGIDPAIRCGLGARNGQSIAFVAQTGVPTTPAGFRTAARVLRLADRLGVSVLTLIDTPGAANDQAAEAAGAGAAIADLLAAMAGLSVPVTSLVIGEGGSGGAIALVAPGSLWMTPDSYFSVIVPEAATSILKRRPDEVAATAGDLQLRPQDVGELGIARGIAGPEPITR